MFLLQNTSYLNLNIILSQNYLSTSTNMGNQLRIFFTHTLRTLYQRYNPSDSISLFIWPLTHYNNNISLKTQLPALWWKEKKTDPIGNQCPPADCWQASSNKLIHRIPEGETSRRVAYWVWHLCIKWSRSSRQIHEVQHCCPSETPDWHNGCCLSHCLWTEHINISSLVCFNDAVPKYIWQLQPHL